MADEVRAYDRLGNKITVSKDEVGKLYALGGRVATRDEQNTHEAEIREGERSEKAGVAGKAQTVIGAVSGAINPLAFQGGPGSTGEAYNHGVTGGLTAGLDAVAERKAIDATAGEDVGARFIQQHDDVKALHPTAHGAGEFMGFAAGSAAAPGIGTAGNLAERGAARLTAGLATRGALGRAAATGVQMGARGAIETALFGASESAAEDLSHDREVDGEKLFTAFGHSALSGGAIGFGLGASGSLLASGVKAARGSLVSRLAEGAEGPRARPLDAIDADAGLREPSPTAEGPFKIGPGRQQMGLRPQGGAARAPSEASPIRFGEGGLSIDPDAGIAPRATTGKFQGKVPAQDALRFGKELPRDVRLGDASAELGPIEARSPIRIPQPEVVPLTGARALAADQAWKAVGAGFGLQTTRYAKEAARYFPGGTRDLGDVAIRYGAFDIPQGAGPMEAAWAAAKSGTPDVIAPKLATATDSVGKQIGEITEASGARVATSDIRRAVEDVAGPLDRKAGFRDRANSVRGYGDELLDVLGAHQRDAVPVQALLEQRKALDELVFQETKALDPKGRVAALRDVRGRLEGVITDALDRASGQIPGELAGKYKGLKRDYHALRILTEAAEDSAARSSKGATFGLGEKLAAATSFASGHFAAAPVLALGGKMLKERGNAAAAAGLTRLADQQAIRIAVRQAGDEVAFAARNALVEAPRPATTAKSSARTTSPEAGREAVTATRSRAEQVASWVAEVQSNPKRFIAELKDAASDLGRSAGPRAASGYTRAAVLAFTYVAKYVPVRERRDPLDPRSVPPMTFEEADRLVRAKRYAEQPRTVFQDFGRGVVTTEGIDAAKTFMPDQFAEFKQQLFGHVTNHMMRSRHLTEVQRLRVDRLLDGMAIRPDEVSRLQANLAAPVPEPSSAPTKNTGGPVNMKIQQSGFDAVEQRKSQ